MNVSPHRVAGFKGSVPGKIDSAMTGQHATRHRGSPRASFLLSVVMVLAVCNTCLASIGINLNDIHSQWTQGPEFQPYGTDPLIFEVGVFGDGFDWMAPNWPVYAFSGEFQNTIPTVTSRLVGVRLGTYEEWQDVSYTEADEPVFPHTLDKVFFRYEVSPSAGEQWPVGTFAVQAGGREVSDPTGPIHATVAISYIFKYYNPYPFNESEVLVNPYQPSVWYSQYGTSGHDPRAFVGVGQAGTPNSSPLEYDRRPGMWVKEGDVFEVDSSGQFRFSYWTGSETIYTEIMDGDGAGDRSSGVYVPELPWGTFVGGIKTATGEFVLLESEGNPDGFVGTGFHTFEAPASGILSFMINPAPHGYKFVEADTVEGMNYHFSARLMTPEPATLTLLAVGGIAVLRKRRKQ